MVGVEVADCLVLGQLPVGEVHAMTNKGYHTDSRYVMIDPLVEPPPTGVDLLVLSPGGITGKSKWYEGAMAWFPLPVVPQSVKDRLYPYGKSDPTKPRV